MFCLQKIIIFLFKIDHKQTDHWSSLTAWLLIKLPGFDLVTIFVNKIEKHLFYTPFSREMLSFSIWNWISHRLLNMCTLFFKNLLIFQINLKIPLQPAPLRILRAPFVFKNDVNLKPCKHASFNRDIKDPEIKTGAVRKNR